MEVHAHLFADIVFVRTWFTVKVPQFYNPVTTLLLPPEQKAQWTGMKTVGQLRREKSIKPPTNSDSIYKVPWPDSTGFLSSVLNALTIKRIFTSQDIERGKKVFKPLVIPRELQKQLPYAAKPKFAPKTMIPSAESKRIAVVREPHEQKVCWSLFNCVQVRVG